MRMPLFAECVRMCSRYNSRDARAACRALQIRPFPARWWVYHCVKTASYL